MACSTSTLPEGRARIADQHAPRTGEPIVREADDALTNGSDEQSPAAGVIEPRGPSDELPEHSSEVSGTQPEPPVGGSTVGITANSITISYTAGFSSIYGQVIEKAYRNGVETWQREINAKGGIHGRKIIVHKVDNQGTAEGAVAACKEAATNGSFLVYMGSGLPSDDDCLDKAGIPEVVTSPAELRSSWRNVLAVFYPKYVAPTYVSFLKSSYMNAARKKIGIVLNTDIPQNTSEYNGLVPALASGGLQLVHTEKVTTSQASFVSEMSRMRDSGAETVLMLVGQEASGVLRDAKAIGYEPQWFATILSSFDLLAKTGGETYKGIRGLRGVTGTETTAFASYVTKVRSFQGDAAAASADTLDAAFYALADVMGKVLELAGPNVTRESFLATARAMNPYNNGLLPPVSWKGRPVGTIALFPVVCCKRDYTFSLLGPARERF